MTRVIRHVRAVSLRVLSVLWNHSRSIAPTVADFASGCLGYRI
jgi:hypothetical protein